MIRHKIIVACTKRRCAVVQYTGISSPLSLKERVIELGENASSIDVNLKFAQIGVLDSGKNTIAFYRIEELLWPDEDCDVAEYQMQNYGTQNVWLCRANQKLIVHKNVKGAVCGCLDGFYMETETNMC